MEFRRRYIRSSANGVRRCFGLGPIQLRHGFCADTGIYGRGLDAERYCTVCGVVTVAAHDCGASARCACNAVQYSLFADGARRHVCRLCPLRVVCRHWFLACRVCDGGDIADSGILVLAPRNAPTCSWGCPFKDKRQRPERETGIFAPPGAPARANMSCSRSERPCQGWYADLDAVLSFR